ncbi:hypothetical protein [Cupriavidus pauculus]|uniref:hypothetical protein n=1 Tax=Cupriavidus pauculus TaxID=82633 RepID=UPI001D0C1579|nr:hypothetical protein [Cupriavidus pauculus]
MQSRLSELVRMAKDAGAEILDKHQKAGRASIELKAPNGVTRKFSISLSPNDARGDLNERSRIRRFMNENDPAAQKPEPVEPPANGPEPLNPVIPQPQPRRTITVSQQTSSKAGAAKSSQAIKPSTATAERELTHAEFYALCEWIKAAKLSEFASAEVMAHIGLQVIGQTISEATLRETMALVKIEEPEHWKPQEPDHIIVARELDALMKRLGEPASPAFSRLIGALS